MNGQTQVLLRHFTDQLGILEEIHHRDTPWHSATFSGARHCFAFTVDPAADVTAFASGLPEADFALPGGFVADAAVAVTDGTRITVEILTIDAA